MKKFLILGLCALSLLSGCSKAKIKDEQQKIYNGFRDSLMDNGELFSSNIPFDYSITVEKVDSQYHYTVIVNSPKVAMSNIQMMILNPKDVEKEIETATVGIFDETSYNMIPNQGDEKYGYYRQLELKGVSAEKNFVVYSTVAWKDSNQLIQYQVYFSFKVKNGKVVKG